MEIATIVLIVLNVIFGLCILLGFLWGLKRGVKKSAVRIASIAISLVLAYFIAIPVTSALINMDLSNFISQQGSDGQPISSIEDLIVDAITSNESVAEAYNNSESMRALIEALPQMLIQCIIFVILFWIFKLISWVVYAIIAKCIWGKKKKTKEQKAQEKQENRTIQNGRPIENGNVRPVPEKPVKKYRWAGAAVGTLQGFMIAFFTMIPLAGIASIVTEIDKSSTAIQAYSAVDSQDDNQLDPLGDMLREMVGNDVVDALKAYDSTALGVICGWTGVDDWAFDVQSSATIGDTHTTLRRELLSLVNAYDQAQQIQSFNLQELNFDTLQKLFDYLFESRALTSIADDLIPYYVDKVVNDPQVDMNAEIKDFLNLYLETYDTPTMNDLKLDLSSIITAMKVIQENDVFAIIEDEDFSFDRLIDVLEDKDGNTPIKNIFVALTNSTTIQKVLQVGVNYSLDYLSNELTELQGSTIQIQHATFENIDWNAVSDEIPTIANNIIDLYRDYCIDGNVDDKILNVNFVNVGKTLDLLTSSSLLQEAYDNAMVALNQVTEYSQYIDFSALTSDMSYEQEFTYVQNVVDALGQVDALTFITDSTISAQEFVERLGQDVNANETCIEVIANNLTNSSILKAAAPRSLNVLYRDYIQPDVEYIIDAIDATNIDWQVEKQSLVTLITYVADNAEYFLNNIDAELIIKNVDLEGLGVSLDAMKVSDLLYPIYKVGVQLIKDSEDVKEYINTDAINYDTNWAQEMLNLQQAVNEAKDAGVVDAIFEDNGINQVLDILNNDKTIIEGIVDHLFDSTIMQYSVENLVNQLQNLIGEQIDITIQPTYVDIQNFIDNLDTKKQEFSNIINNIAVVAHPIMQSNFNLDVFADNIDAFALAFDSLQDSSEFHNTYTGIIDYLSNNQTINEVIDFSIVGDNFDFISEFNTIEQIITILKNNNAWAPLVEGTSTVDEVVDSLDTDTKAEVTELILESKLFSGLAVDALNNMIEEFNGYLGTSIAPISEGTDLSTQSSNIASVTKHLLELTNNGMQEIILNQIDMSIFGNLLTSLKENKFVYNGALSEVYTELVNYMVSDQDYGYLINDVCMVYGETIAPSANGNVDWIEICDAFGRLIDMESELEVIQELQANDVVNILDTIGNNENVLVERLAKTYLKHGKAAESAQAIDDFDFGDTQFNSQAIEILYDIKDVGTALDSNVDTALGGLSNSLIALDALDRTKLDSLIAFIDATTNSALMETIDGANFATEAQLVQEFRNLLNHQGDLTLQILRDSITAFNDSTLILNELYNNNIIICDIQSESVMQGLKNSIASSLPGVQPEDIPDQYVVEAIQTIISETVDPDKQDKISSILGLSN